MDLTPLEREILNHRLVGCPDAIADAMEDSGHDPAEVAEAIDRMATGLPAVTDADKEVLADCVEGSTYYGASDGGDLSPQRMAAIARAGESLARKVSEVVGRRVVFPCH